MLRTLGVDVSTPKARAQGEALGIQTSRKPGRSAAMRALRAIGLTGHEFVDEVDRLMRRFD